MKKDVMLDMVWIIGWSGSRGRVEVGAEGEGHDEEIRVKIGGKARWGRWEKMGEKNRCERE